MWKPVLIIVLGSLTAPAFSDTPYCRMWGNANQPSHVLDQTAALAMEAMPSWARLEGSVKINPLLPSLRSDVAKAEADLRVRPSANATAAQIEGSNIQQRGALASMAQKNLKQAVKVEFTVLDIVHLQSVQTPPAAAAAAGQANPWKPGDRAALGQVAEYVVIGKISDVAAATAYSLAEQAQLADINKRFPTGPDATEIRTSSGVGVMDAIIQSNAANRGQKTTPKVAPKDTGRAEAMTAFTTKLEARKPAHIAYILAKPQAAKAMAKGQQQSLLATVVGASVYVYSPTADAASGNGPGTYVGMEYLLVAFDDQKQAATQVAGDPASGPDKSVALSIVTLKDGRTIRGTIIEENETMLVIQQALGKLSVQKANVLRIEH